MDNRKKQNRRFLTHELHTVEFALPEGVYSQPEYIGGGTYGNVVKANWHRNDGEVGEVAIKKLYEPFRDDISARRVFRELRLLRLMRHENVVRLVDLYTPDTSPGSLRNIYVVTEYAGHSLHAVLRRQRENGRAILQPSHIKFLIYQILRALKYIHSANVIHRDLKPGNLAINVECDLTVLDFGLARNISANNHLTAYVMTRWYRSPEVIYWNIGSYSSKVDVWSVGCILAELLIGEPLFPGEDAPAQYRLITQLCGSPDEAMMAKIESKNQASMRLVIESMGIHPRKNFHEHFGAYGDDVADFLDRILVLDPDRRMSVEDAISHPYLSEYSMPSDEPVSESPLLIDETGGDENVTDIAVWKERIWNEIQSFTRLK